MGRSSQCPPELLDGAAEAAREKDDGCYEEDREQQGVHVAHPAQEIWQCRYEQSAQDRSRDGPRASEDRDQQEVDRSIHPKAVDADERDVVSKETSCERTKEGAGDEHPFFKSSDIHAEHRRRRWSVPHRPHRYSRSRIQQIAVNQNYDQDNRPHQIVEAKGCIEGVVEQRYRRNSSNAQRSASEPLPLQKKHMADDGESESS